MNCTEATFPSLHHRKEGWLRHQENAAQRPKPAQTGWFSSSREWKTILEAARCRACAARPSALSADASRYFLNCATTPLSLRLRAVALALCGGDAE